jgi:hypothetical protein
MTIDELIDKIKHLEWHFDDQGMIRCADGKCPIVAAANLNLSKATKRFNKWNNFEYWRAAESIGLEESPDVVIAAADGIAPRGYPPNEAAKAIREKFIKRLITK